MKGSSGVQFFLCALAAAATVGSGCEKSHGIAGGESHFLANCTDDEDCGALRCMAGVCTRTCAPSKGCRGLEAQCVDASQAGAADEAPESVCDVPCDGDATCRVGLGADFVCDRSRCRTPAPALARDPEDAQLGDSPARAIEDGGRPDLNRQDAAAVEAAAVDAAAVDAAHTRTGARDAFAPDEATVYDAAAGAELDAANPCPQSGFAEDERCLQPPHPEEGIQIRIGPPSYEPVDVAPWVVDVGQEQTLCWSFHMPNTEDFAYGAWEYSARSAVHHAHQALVATDVMDGAFEACADPLGDGTSDSVLAALPFSPQSNDFHAQAPENASSGRMVPAGAHAQSWIHAFNTSREPALLEIWINLYYATGASVEAERPLRARSPLIMLEGTEGDSTLSFDCPVDGRGRLLSLHAPTFWDSATGFDRWVKEGLSVWLTRQSGARLLLGEQAAERDREYYFDSITRNAELGSGYGAHSGVVELEPGDTLEWECRVTYPEGGPLSAPPPGPQAVRCDLNGSTIGTDVRCQSR